MKEIVKKLATEWEKVHPFARYFAYLIIAFFIGHFLDLVLHLATLLACPLTLLAMLAFPFALGGVLLKVRKRRFKATFRDLAVVLAFAMLFLHISYFRWGVRIAQVHLFRAKFERIISEAEARFPEGSEPMNVHVSYHGWTPIAISHSYREESGQLVVVFFMDGGFPVKHRGFLYVSKDNPGDPWLRKNWRRRMRWKENWYAISD